MEGIDGIRLPLIHERYFVMPSLVLSTPCKWLALFRAVVRRGSSTPRQYAEALRRGRGVRRGVRRGERRGVRRAVRRAVRRGSTPEQ